MGLNLYEKVIDSFYNNFIIYKLQKDNKIEKLLCMDIESLKDYNNIFKLWLKQLEKEKLNYKDEFETVFNKSFLTSFLKKYEKLLNIKYPISKDEYMLFAILKSSLNGLMHLYYEGLNKEVDTFFIDVENIEPLKLDGSISVDTVLEYTKSFVFKRNSINTEIVNEQVFFDFSIYNIPDYIVLLQLINTYLEDRIPKDYKKYLIDLEDFTQYDYDFKYFLDKNLNIYTEFVKKEFKTDVYEYKPEGKVVTKDELRFGFVSVKSDINSILEYFCNSVISNTHNLLAPSVVDIHSPYRIYAGIYKDRRKLMDEKYKAMGKVYTPPKIFKYWPWIPGEEDSGYWSSRG